MFQDSAGTTAAAVGQTVGLILDKSKGLAIGPELLGAGAPALVGTATTATYNTGTGAATTVRVDGSNLSSIQFAGLTAQSWYKVTVTGASGAVVIRLTNSGGAFVDQFSGSRTVYVNTGAATAINLSPFTNGTSVSFTVASIVLVSGNHAYQSTAASRPILACHPTGGRRNQFVHTEAFANPAWVKGGGGMGLTAVATDGYATAPDGSMTASRVQLSLNGGTTSGDFSRIYQQYNIPGASGVFSIWMRSTDGVSNYVVQMQDPNDFGNPKTVTGTWQQFTVTALDSGAVNYGIRLRGGQTPTNSNTADILIWHPQLEDGSTATAYQKVASSYEITEAGIQTFYHLAHDGVDDYLVTNSIDFSGSDKVTLWAGARKLSDASAALLAELSASASANNGAFYISAPESTGASGNFAFKSRGDNNNGLAASSAVVAPTTVVLTGQGSIAADSSILRINGAQAATAATDQGAGNYGNAYPLYIGRRGGSTLPFNGYLYGLIIRGGASDTAAIQRTERYLGAKTGVTW
ncbi:hypothetical protein [Rhizorhabdus sp.]|uniref:phage head spike fiber domain-containing protein n=1 Tax=Rhizorhabdus sp. TaxID=1968843 RepID=UPI0019AAB226|nr:hypothetical protein [Rhizorhabdus sp.]MBD3761483.1 hypothetical protein [Rhizorhabdus sp.]